MMEIAHQTIDRDNITNSTVHHTDVDGGGGVDGDDENNAKNNVAIEIQQFWWYIQGYTRPPLFKYAPILYIAVISLTIGLLVCVAFVSSSFQWIAGQQSENTFSHN